MSLEEQSSPEKESIDELRKDKLKDIVKEEVKKETKQKNKKIEELQKEIEKLKSNNNRLSKDNNRERNGLNASQHISRRQFLKKISLGTAGLAALMSPVSALNIKSDSLTFSDEANQYLEINTQENMVNIRNADLDLDNQALRNVGGFNIPGQEPEEKTEGNMWVDEGELKVKVRGNVFTMISVLPESGALHDINEDNSLDSYNQVEGIDDFEADQIENLPSDFNAGSGPFDENEGVIYTTSNAGSEGRIDSAQMIVSEPGNNLDFYPFVENVQNGIRMKVTLTYDDRSPIATMVYGFKSLSEAYAVSFFVDDGRLTWDASGETREGSPQEGRSINFLDGTDEWFNGVVEWQENGTHRIYIEEINQSTGEVTNKSEELLVQNEDDIQRGGWGMATGNDTNKWAMTRPRFERLE